MSSETTSLLLMVLLHQTLSRHLLKGESWYLLEELWKMSAHCTHTAFKNQPACM